MSHSHWGRTKDTAFLIDKWFIQDFHTTVVGISWLLLLTSWNESSDNKKKKKKETHNRLLLLRSPKTCKGSGRHMLPHSIPRYPAGSPKLHHLKHKEGSPNLERSKCITSKKQTCRLPATRFWTGNDISWHWLWKI